jgi:hypothetical protein
MGTLRAIEIESPRAAAREGAVAELRAAFPHLPVRPIASHTRPAAGTLSVRGSTVLVGAGAWDAPDLDPLRLDDAVAVAAARGPFVVTVLDDGRVPDPALTTIQIVTRCQRHVDARNQHSAVPLFDAVLARHRQLHDLGKPLVAADFDHARDTWRWVLRLAPLAGLPVQIAALFHDIERLSSESDTRVEQHAVDYEAFKRAHAAAGARVTRETLEGIGAPAMLAARVAALVEEHERPSAGADPDRVLLAEADALSFFSLNAPGFARYYGPLHTEKKVAYTLSRLGPRGRQALGRIRHRADIAAMIARVQEPAVGAA